MNLKVCHRLCYWKKKGECTFPPEGLNLWSRLESERERLMQELERVKTNTLAGRERRDVWRPDGKGDEAASEISELTKELAREESIKERLNEVEHALDKFDNGTCGLCDSCGQPIDLARLEALPQASLCLSCKAQGEKKAKSRSIPQRERAARNPRYDEKMHILNFNVLEPADLVEDMEDEQV